MILTKVGTLSIVKCDSHLGQIIDSRPQTKKNCGKLIKGGLGKIPKINNRGGQLFGTLEYAPKW